MVSGDNDLEFSVVSGSSEEMLFGCLESLTQTMEGSRYRWSVTVTCNTLGKGLAVRVRDLYPDAAVIDNDAPRGFAANHNRVLLASPARYVWLLNDDLMILPDAIRLVTEFMDRAENARVAATSPKLLNADGSLQPSTYGFPSMPQIFLAHSGLRDLRIIDLLLSRLAPLIRSREGSSRFWDHDRTIDVDTLRGACVAMRMTAVHEVGPMVEVAQVGAEETEWHRRLREHGWRVVYFSEAQVVHFGSQTVRAGTRDLYPEYLRGALYFFRTGRGPAAYSVLCASLLAMFGVRHVVAWLGGDRKAKDVAGEYASVAWDGLRRR